MKNKIIGGLLLFVGALILLTPRYIFPTCEYQGFKAMACSYTGTAEMFAGFIIITASAGMFFSKSNEALRWLSLTVFAAGVTVVLLPEKIGYCHSSEMPCHYATVPALRLFGALTLIISLTGMMITLRKTGDNI
ncbi:MAG: DUF4418 family protein [Nitrospirae bacterium]|nr:DUF4418 family protein [Nitrospirota bacterium]